MGTLDVGTKIFRALWPPEHDQDPTPWRRAVFLMLIFISLILAFHLLGAKGYLSMMGVSAVADAAQVQEVEKKTNAILYAIYAPQVRQKVRERCETSEADEREEINRELDRILGDYKEATGEAFSPMPRCGEV